MNYKVDSGKLFEGLDEIVAKTMKDASMRVLTSRAVVEPNQHEIVGNTAVKADAPLLEQPTAEGADVYVDIEEWYEFLEWRNGRKEKDQDRIARYKELYEDEREENNKLEDKIREMAEEIKKLRTQLEYAEKHPQSVTNVYGNQHNHLEDNRSQVAVQEMVVKDNGIGVQTSETKEEDNGVNMTEDIKICRFIAQDRIKNNTTYGRTEEERIDSYNRIIYRQSQKKFSSFVKFLKEENMKGNLKFDTQDLEEIYNHLLECYETLHGNLRSFKDACHGSINGKKTNFYWNPI